MRAKHLAATVATAAAFAAPAAISAVDAKPAFARHCSAGFVHGRIGGQQKCLRRGEYCARSHKRQYRKYGFRCYGYPARLH